MITTAKLVSAGINPADYHRIETQRGDVAYPVSPSMLKEFIRCPARWKAGYIPPGSTSMEWGSLVDCLALTPELFGDRYAVKPETYRDAKTGEVKPWNGNANFCKEWLASVPDGVEVIGKAKEADALAAVNALKADSVINAFMTDSDTQVMVTGRWHDDATGLDIPLRCLIDLAPRLDSEFAKCLGDLKTTTSGAIIPFQRQVWKLGWHIQAAFDLDLYTAATGEDRTTWCFVGQESFAPWQPFKRMMSEQYIELGRSQYKRALAAYAACLKRNQWPDYDSNDEAVQGWTLCAPEPWMENEVMFAPKMELEDEAPDDRIDINN